VSILSPLDWVPSGRSVSHGFCGGGVRKFLSGSALGGVVICEKRVVSGDKDEWEENGGKKREGRTKKQRSKQKA